MTAQSGLVQPTLKWGVLAILSLGCSCQSVHMHTVPGTCLGPIDERVPTDKGGLRTAPTASTHFVDFPRQSSAKQNGAEVWRSDELAMLKTRQVRTVSAIEREIQTGFINPASFAHVSLPDVRLADEYLCDGGDRQTRVAVNQDWVVSGVDLEDTFGHFDTIDGRTIVTPSNDVCIYSPRFAAVRKIVQTSQDEERLAMQSVNLPLSPLTEQLAKGPTRIDRLVPAQHAIGLWGPLGLRHRTRGLELLHALPVAELGNVLKVHEDFQIIRLGIHSRRERPLIEQFVRAAEEWTDNLAPEVMIESEPAIVDTTVEKLATLHHFGLESTPRLRVLKLASRDSAQPGEEVMFTLRFDNVGEQTIGNVTILDNLTTRLEYVPDSAECSVQAEFFTDPNQGESLALRWEIQQPMKPGEGGIIRFRCQVR